MIRKSHALRYSLLTASLAVLALAAPSARAAINGFGDGSNYTLTGYTTDPNTGAVIDTTAPTISAGVLTITTASDSESRAAFYNTAQPVGPFLATFVYQNDPQSEPGLGAADGVAFVIQNDPRGLSAVGGGGASLGYGGNAPSPYSAIANSASLQLLLRTDGGPSTAYETAGDIGFNTGTNTAPVNLESGHPIFITLAYDGASTLTETFLDLTTSDFQSFTTPADISSALGVPTAFVGFTGGTGGGYSTQTISNFTFVPEPASLSLLVACPFFLRRRRA